MRIVEEDPKDRESQSSGGDLSVLGSQYSRTKINREIRAQADEDGVTALCRLKSQRHSTGVAAPEDIGEQEVMERAKAEEVGEPEVATAAQLSP